MITAQKYGIESTASIGLTYAPELEGFYTLSPFVWRDDDMYRLLLRLVNRASDQHEKVARIHAGTSHDGVTFALDSVPAIAPGHGGPDADGCEDPTAVVRSDEVLVYYSGWNERSERSELLLARGPNPGALTKAGIALPWTGAHRNPKEATVAQCSDGSWVMFFEYAVTDASRIGLARSPQAAGPWTIDNAFVFQPRVDMWDRFHLSPGPFDLRDPRRPVMFYNGSGKNADWRIGWAAFDENFSRIVDRGAGPVITPPVPEGDESDIAFAASAIAIGDTIDLYYSVADKFLRRATLTGAP